MNNGLKVGLASVGIATVIGSVAMFSGGKTEIYPFLETITCRIGEISLESNDRRICLTKQQYPIIKKRLLNEYNDKTKDYDFDINKREILSAVLNKELNDKGISIRDTDKEKIKKELIKLLTK